jgi:glycine/D-amino acid oxidase-like deaminating enzyme
MTSVTGLIRAGGAVKGVRTSAGDIAAGAVVNAAGPWAHTVAQWAGLDVSLTVTREEEVILDMRDAGGPPRLVVSDGCRATYYRPVRPSQTLVGRGFPKDYQEVDPDHFKESADSEFIQDVTARVTARFPSFEQAQVIRAYTGLYDVSRDWHPILGKVDGVEGLYMCFGFSGHGFKIAPAVGELMAQEILDGAAHSIDIGSLRLERFAKGELLQGAYGGNRA